jgi:hypothetical protein
VEEHARHWSGPFAIIPRHLPRTDWEKLSPEKIRAEMRAAVAGNQEAR